MARLEEENGKAQFIFDGIREQSEALDRKNRELQGDISIDEEQLEALRVELEKEKRKSVGI